MLDALQNEGHPARLVVGELLAESSHPNALAILASSLTSRRAPSALREVAAGRVDVAALEVLLDPIGVALTADQREACQQVEQFAWLEPSALRVLLRLSTRSQAAAITAAAASRASRRSVAACVALLLSNGGVEAQVAAAKAIDRLPSHLAVDPLGQALRCESGDAVAIAARMLDRKNFPNASEELVRLLDHPDHGVRAAAQRSLQGLSFSDYRDGLQEIPEAARSRVGQLVAKADPLALASLRSELRSGAVARRLHALEMVELMRLESKMTGALVTGLSDVDAGVRCEAARLLGETEGSAEIAEALREACLDAVSAVRDAAQASLARLKPSALAPAWTD